VSNDGDTISGFLGAANYREIVNRSEDIDHEAPVSAVSPEEYDYEII